MERLNNILPRTAQKRQQASEQRLGQGYRPGQSPLHRPLSEQPMRVQDSPAQTSQSYNQPHPQNVLPRTHDEQVVRRNLRSSQQPMPQGSRPLYNQPYPERKETEDLSTLQHPIDAGQRFSRNQGWSHSINVRSDQREPYPAMTPADVREEWEDDTESMRYGDWENDAEDEQELPQTRLERLSLANRSLTAREASASQDSGRGPRYTRNLRDVRMPPAHLPTPEALAQELSRTHRATQPLHPQSLGRMRQEYPQEAPLIQQPSQVALPEQSAAKPVRTSTASPGSCPLCKGAGYLRVDVPYGHPNFGKPIPCECKEAERKEKRRRQLYEMSNLGAFQDKMFRSFNPRVPGLNDAFKAAYEFAQNPDGWLLLIGPNGCGKTHLAAAIANQSLDDGALVLFATVPDLLDHLRAAFAPSSEEVYDQLFARMREAELLILDDLGSQQSSPWANEKLFQLLNYRYNSRFPTVITANTQGMQNIDERIRSRLTDASLVYTIVLNRAQDYRPHNPRR